MSPVPNVAVHIPTRWGGPIPATEEFITFFQRSEELGFHSLWVYDMMLYKINAMDPLTMLSYAAACTKRIGLGVNALLLSLRHPVGLAKQIGTLDALSGGRMTLAVAMGGRDDEYEAMNMPQRQRVGRLEEGMTVLRRLWTETDVTFHGRYYNLENANVQPKPPRPDGIPLLIGASTVPGMQRAGRIADGWTRGGRGAPEEFAKEWAIVQEAAREAGRDPSTLINVKTLYINVDSDRDRARRELEEHFDAYRNPGLPQVKDCVVGTPADIVDAIRVLGEADCQTVCLGLPWPDVAKLEMIAEGVLPAFQ